MKISKKLTLNSIIILALMAAVGLTSFIGVKYIQKSILSLTQKSTPYQIKALDHQRALQAHAVNLLKVSVSDTVDEFKEISAKANESILEEVKSAEELTKLGATTDYANDTISEITRSIIGITAKRLELQSETSASVETIRKRLSETSAKINELDASVRKLQQSSSAKMLSDIDKTTGMNRQTSYLTAISDGFKDLLIQIPKISLTNDKRSLTGIKTSVEETAKSILQAVNSVEWPDKKTGDEITQRVKDQSLKLIGAVNLRMKYINEEDESLKSKSESIAKDAEYEITYIMPSVLKELGNTNTQLKTGTSDMAKSVNAFTETNSILIQSSAILSLNAFIESQINYSLSVKNVSHFEKTVSVIESTFVQIDKTMLRLKELLTKGNFRSELNALNTSSVALLTIKNGFLGNNGVADKTKAYLRNIDEVGKLNARMKEMVSKQILESSKDVASAQKSQEDAVSSLKSAVNATVMFIFIIVGFAVLASIMLSRWIIRSIISPVKELSTVAMGFGNGDFSIRMDSIKKDEFGNLAVHLNQATTKLSEITFQISETIKKLASSSGNLLVTSEELYKGAQEQAFQTDQSANALTEISQTITTVAKNAADASATSKNALDMAVKGKEIVDKTVHGMEKISVSVSESSLTIKKLSESSNKISAIVNVIQEITDQTNLLALNAAVEAARAGAQGRGFAVVADEVKKLAERSNTATNEIGSIIQEIHSNVEKSVYAMQQGKESVDEGVNLAGNAGKSLEAIVNASQRGVDMAVTIAAATEEQSVTIEHVSQGMEQITNITKKLEESMLEIKHEAEDLAGLSNELNRMASWFKLI